MRIFQPFRSVNYRYLFSATLCFFFATFIDLMAFIAIIAYELNRGAIGLAAMSVCYALPMIIGGLFAGKIAERVNIARIMLITFLLRIILMFFLFVYANHFYALLSILALKSLLSSFDAPCAVLAVKKLVSDTYLEQAASLGQLIVSMSKIVAPSIAGLLLLVMAAHNIFLVSMVLYALAFVFVIPIYRLLGKKNEHNKVQVGEKENQENKTDSRNVWALLRTDRVLSLLLFSAGIAFFIIMIVDSFTALLFKNVGFDASILGFFVAFVGIGSVLSNLVIGSQQRIKYMPTLNIAIVILGFLTFIIGMIDTSFVQHTFPWLISVYMVYIMGFLLGISAGMFFGTQAVYLIRNVPGNALGRVTSLNSIIMASAQLCAPLIGAFLIEYLSVSTTYIMCGILLLLFAIIFLLSEKTAKH